VIYSSIIIVIVILSLFFHKSYSDLTKQFVKIMMNLAEIYSGNDWRFTGSCMSIYTELWEISWKLFSLRCREADPHFTDGCTDYN
jgi:hypothetical protein